MAHLVRATMGLTVALGACAAESSTDMPDAQSAVRYSFGGLGAAKQHLAMDTDSTAADSHDYFSTASIDSKDSVTLSALGDLWVNCWSDDDSVYIASGDGTGFDSAVVAEIVVSRIDGRPDSPDDRLRATTLSAGDSVAQRWGVGNTMKPTGMLCVNGELYLAVQDLPALQFTEAPAATIVRSIDKGRTWTWDRRAPMFSDHVFTTIMFADFGKDSQHAPDAYAYAYGFDDNWSSVYSDRQPQSRMYLARVPNDRIQDRASWEFFTGLTEAGAATWNQDIARRAPVLEDTNRRYTTPLDSNLARQNMTMMNQGDVVFDAALNRYIFATWTMYTFELYEAPQPWGPWTHFYTKDFGVFPWTEDSTGGYGTTIPTKFISPDGQTLWMHSTVWEAGVTKYQYALRKVQLTRFEPSEPSNSRSPASLSTAALGVVPIFRVARSGHPERLSDGVLTKQSEESWSGERRADDHWGYTWPQAMRVNKLRYTTGSRDTRGGWFTALTVQARHGKAWEPVSNLHVTPDYGFDENVLGNQTFTFSFDETVTDGVRLYGTPGGAETFTNIAELSVHYE